MSSHDELLSIKPTRRRRVYDVVKEAGLDVTDWSNYVHGDKTPAANPRYCYEWAFLGEQCAVLNLWYEDMEIQDECIVQTLNQRSFRDSQRGIPGRGVVIQRAQSMDSIIAEAFDRRLPVRVVVCYNGNDENKVNRRDLDPEYWSVSEYDHETGRATIRRGFAPNAYYDQYSVPPSPKGNLSPVKTQSTTYEYERDSAVREYVRRRAQGTCEYCHSLGFRTTDGGVFIETHHIIPLSEDGPDTTDNVIGLCPNHHREAHHGVNKDRLRDRFLEILAGYSGSE